MYKRNNQSFRPVNILFSTNSHAVSLCLGGGGRGGSRHLGFGGIGDTQQLSGNYSVQKSTINFASSVMPSTPEYNYVYASAFIFLFGLLIVSSCD